MRTEKLPRPAAARAVIDGRAVPLDDEAAAILAANFMELADRDLTKIVADLNRAEDEARAEGRPSPYPQQSPAVSPAPDAAA